MCEFFFILQINRLINYHKIAPILLNVKGILMQSTHPSESSTNGTSINLFEYLEVIAKSWKMIAIVTTVAFIISIIASLLQTKIYSSTTLILPPQQDSGMMNIMMGVMGSGMANIASDLLGGKSTADLYVGILNSDAVKDEVISKFKLKDIYKLEFRLDTYKKLDSAVDVSTGKKDGIISITVQDKDPKLATDIANAYVDILGNLLSRLNMTGATQNKRFLEERIAKTKIDLYLAEDNLKSFQSKNKTLDLTEQAKGTIKSVADLMAQLALEEVKQISLQRSLTDASQEVKNQKIIVTKLKEHINLLEGSKKGGSIPSVGSIPDLGQKNVRLLREFKIQETLLELLTKQYEMAKLTEINDVQTIQVIQKATIPDKKIKPKRAIIVIASTFIAFGVAIIYAFITDTICRLSKEDISRLNKIKALLLNCC